MNPVISPAELKPPASVTTDEHIFRSKLPDLPYIPNHLPLHDYCFEKLPYILDRPCLIVGATGETFSYADTRLLCRKTAASLKKLGIGKGDVVMILLHNCPEFVFSFMGASMISAVSTMANPSSTATEILNQVKSCNAKIVITESRYVNKLQSGAGNSDNPESSVPVEVITINGDAQDGCLQFSALLSDLVPENKEEGDDWGNNVQSSFSSTDPVVVPFSSGTTGQQKGVILTHKSLITSVAQQVDGDNPNRFMNEEDVVLCLLPLSHIFSLSSVLLCALRAGSTIVLMKKFEMRVMLELIEKYCVTVLVLVPPLITALAGDPTVETFDLTSVRVVLSGAGQLGKELDADLRSRLPRAVLGQGYGMTEAGPVITMCLGFAKEPFPSKHLSCGTVVRNTEMKVIDAESGSSLSYNQSGEICIRGNQIMKGYLNNDAATAATIDPDGWLHTGDIGYIDDNEEVFIVDRVKDIIQYKNFKVKPTELEALLVSHPGIADAAVVSRKEEDAGEVPVAFVVRSTNGSNDHDQLISEEAIKEFITKQLVGYLYKKLHNVFFVHTIPKSPFGKIMRKELRAKVASGVSKS